MSLITGPGVFDNFLADIKVGLVKWGVPKVKAEIARIFTDVGGAPQAIKHHHERFTRSITGGDHRDGPGVADQPKRGAGRWGDCPEMKGGKITRLFIFPDPDYAGNHTASQGWFTA